MVAAVGPAIFDYVTRDLVERNLQLHQRFARDTELGTDPLQTIAQSGELRYLVADDDFDAPSGGLWHRLDIATFSRKHVNSRAPRVAACGSRVRGAQSCGVRHAGDRAPS